MKKCISIITCVVFTISFLFVFRVYADERTVNLNSAISEELKGVMDKTDNPNDKIPVSVRFDDDYDEVEIEEAAYQRSGIKQDFFETEEIRINSMSNSMKSQGATELEISSYREEEQKELKREIDRYREHRNKSITHFGKKSMVSFLLNSGIEVDSVQSVCVGIPFVPLVWLTAEQICALDDNPLVTNLDYVDVNCELEDYASVEDARAIIGGKL